jgi:translation elongation factor P/translation initiation factor 5A
MDPQTVKKGKEMNIKGNPNQVIKFILFNRAKSQSSKGRTGVNVIKSPRVYHK